MTVDEKVYVIINEQHTLLPAQEKELKECFGDAPVEEVLIPAEGMSIKDQGKLIEYLEEKSGALVFVSPLPVMLAHAAFGKGMIEQEKADNMGYSHVDYPDVFVFANDKREKKELPNGKVISVVAKEGWKLIRA